MKKKLSLILAFLMAASMAMAGCKKTDDTSSGMPDTQTSMPTITQMTTTTTAEETTETTTEPETETETSSETEETSETTSASETTTSATAVSATETTAAKTSQAWNETEISETLYIKTACYSRKRAIVGSESVKKYSVGTKINVVAATDTGYYKLADGTFIHSDYVTDQAPKAETTTTTAATTAKKTDPDKDKTSSNKPISSTYNKSYTEKYPYQQLSSAEKQLYANMVKAAENFDPTFEVPDGITSVEMYKVALLVFNNEPQLFWLSTSVPIGYGTANMNYAISRSEAEEIQKTIDANVKSIMSKVNGYSSTISKLKVIHDWVVTNNIFEKQGTFETCGIYNGLTGLGHLQCQGYAKTVQYLCDVAGIECMVVSGTNSEGASHAWNIVYCDNGYYILDTTWDDPESSYGRASYVRYLYFLANDELTANTHFNINTTNYNGTTIKLYDPPACTKSSCYYFKAYNKEYDDLDSALEGMYAAIDDAISSKKQAACIRVTSHDLWETLTANSYAKQFSKYAKSKDSNVRTIYPQNTEKAESLLVVEVDIAFN